MSQSEDYLDSLLNSINKAKSDAQATIDQAKQTQDEQINTRQRYSTEDDFMSASGIASYEAAPIRHTFLRKAFSESEFLKEFEDEIENGTADAFIEDFEREIDEEEEMFLQTGGISEAENAVAAFLGDVDAAVNMATDSIDNDSVPAAPELNPKDVTDLTDSSVDFSVEEAFPNLDLSPEEPDSASGKSKSGDNKLMDSSSLLFDIPLAVDEEPIESLEPALSDDAEVSLEELMSSGDDADLSDISDLLDADENGTTLDEAIEGFDELASNPSLPEDSDESSDTSDTKTKKKSFFSKLKDILFGDDDDDDDDELNVSNNTVTSDSDEDMFAALAAGGDTADAGNTKAADKSKKEKKEKPKKEKKAKEPKAKEPKAPKPPKAPKEKKPKKVDNSPVIPMKKLLVFFVLSVSLIAIVVVFSKIMGQNRSINVAADYYEKGDFRSAYNILNEMELKNDDQIELRKKARLLADLQQCLDEYGVFMKMKDYEQALDSLVIGMGTYVEYSDMAESYGVSSYYASYGDKIRSQLGMQFGLSEDEALEIYNKKNRHYYTIAIRQALLDVGLDYK